MRAWRDFTHSSVQLPLACGIFTTLAVFVFAVLLRTLLGKTSITKANFFHDHFHPITAKTIKMLS